MNDRYCNHQNENALLDCMSPSVGIIAGVPLCAEHLRELRDAMIETDYQTPIQKACRMCTELATGELNKVPLCDRHAQEEIAKLPPGQLFTLQPGVSVGRVADSIKLPKGHSSNFNLDTLPLELARQQLEKRERLARDILLALIRSERLSRASRTELVECSYEIANEFEKQTKEQKL
jgi:hypothetical protein